MAGFRFCHQYINIFFKSEEKVQYLLDRGEGRLRQKCSCSVRSGRRGDATAEIMLKRPRIFCVFLKNKVFYDIIK